MEKKCDFIHARFRFRKFQYYFSYTVVCMHSAETLLACSERSIIPACRPHGASHLISIIICLHAAGDCIILAYLLHTVNLLCMVNVYHAIHQPLKK